LPGLTHARTGQRCELRQDHEDGRAGQETADHRVGDVFNQFAAAGQPDQDLEHAGADHQYGEVDKQFTVAGTRLAQRSQCATE
jgi:hypothetical protein